MIVQRAFICARAHATATCNKMEIKTRRVNQSRISRGKEERRRVKYDFSICSSVVDDGCDF